MADYMASLNMATSKYKMQQFEEAYNHFSQIALEHGQTPELSFYAASSLIGSLARNPLGYFENYNGVIQVIFQNYRNAIEQVYSDPELSDYLGMYITETVNVLETMIQGMDSAIAQQEKVIKQIKSGSNVNFLIALLLLIFGRTKTSQVDRSMAFNAVGSGAQQRQTASQAKQILVAVKVIRDEVARCSQLFVNILEQATTTADIDSYRDRLR